jgi:acetolactate synthase-1/2/3 large subunit
LTALTAPDQTVIVGQYLGFVGCDCAAGLPCLRLPGALFGAQKGAEVQRNDPVQTSDPVRTSDQIAGMFRAYGVSHFFFVPVILPEVLKRMSGLGITPVMCHGEKAAAYMADGYARVSGKVGVCGAQAIGSTNLAAGLRDPYLARVPVLALSGVPNVVTRHRNLYQDVDDHGAFEAVTKWNGHVPDESRFPDLLRQAFRTAATPACRPVHLELAGRTGNSGDSPAAGDGRAEPRYGLAPSDRPQADREAIAQAISILAEAQRPVILAGNGVARSGAAAEVRALAQGLRIPVMTSLNGIATLPYDHPLYGGVVGEYGADGANRILLEADVILVLGSSLGSMTTRSWSLLPERARIIQVDAEGEEIGRNFPVAVPVVADVRAAVAQLRASASRPAPQAWLDRVVQLRADWRAEIADAETSAAVPIRPERLFAQVGRELADDGIIVGDTGHSGAWSARHMQLRDGQTMIRAAGSLGWSLPAAIGAKCACPDREVICLTGDAGFYYHIAELETARRYGVNVIVVVNDNLGMNQEARLWDSGNADQRKNWTFTDVSFADVARGFGCHGERVEDPASFAGALEKARSAGLPAVIDVRTDPAVVAPPSYGPTL